jgi:hypothetical protein
VISRRAPIALVSAAVVVLAAAAPLGAASSPPGCDGTIVVAPGESAQPALERAEPGDTIELRPGDHRGALHTVRSGTSSAPITICGPRSAVVRGTDYDQRVVEVNHDHITLRGFTIDGRFGADPGDKNAYAGRLIYAIGTRPRDGVAGMRILRMRLQNAGGECVRIRYFSQRNEIAHSEFRTCGLYDFRFGEGGENGEAVYIGTAPEQRGESGAPDSAKDHSNRNHVHHNTMVTHGNECVDIKEDSRLNLVEHNDCSGQRDPDSAGFDSRGNRNTFRFNRSHENRGSGIRFGGDGRHDGLRNRAYGNVIRHNGQYGIAALREPQGLICGNRIRKNARGDFRAPRARLKRYRAPCPRGTRSRP